MVKQPKPVDGCPDHRRFQFSLRSLFVLTFVVALFCSAATTFTGLTRTLVIAGLAWTIAGTLCLRLRVYRDIVVASHLCGPYFVIIPFVAAEHGHPDFWKALSEAFAAGLWASAIALYGVFFWLRQR